MYDVTHSRTPGECRYPLIEPRIWTCPGCERRTPRWTSVGSGAHNYLPEQCKWATAPIRNSTKRHGKHPRPGRKKASDEPTAGLPATTPEGELGAGDEAAAPPAPPKDVVSAGGEEADPPSSGGSSSSTTPPAPAGRGPDQQQRTRRTWQDSGTGDANPSDWSQYDIQRVIRALGCSTEAGRRRLLRKLHLRWWHASAAPMKRLLKHAGMPDSVLDLVDEIVETCSVCRT